MAGAGSGGHLSNGILHEGQRVGPWGCLEASHWRGVPRKEQIFIWNNIDPLTIEHQLPYLRAVGYVTESVPKLNCIAEFPDVPINLCFLDFSPAPCLRCNWHR